MHTYGKLKALREFVPLRVSTAGIFQAIGGAIFGPFAAFLAGFGGAFLGSKIAGEFTEEFTEEFFDIPKTEAEEKAYNYFGIDKHASNAEINRAYRAKSQLYHPDNRQTGNEKEFLSANINLQIIKMARKNT